MRTSSWSGTGTVVVVETTAHYLHVTPQRVGQRASPLDLLRLTPVSPA